MPKLSTTPKVQQRSLYSPQSSSACCQGVLAGPRAKHHTFSLAYIGLALAIYSKGVSLRTTIEVLGLLKEYLPGFGKLAAYTSLRSWKVKFGLNNLETSQTVKEGNYALITDLSMMVGKRRLLLVVAVRLDDWTFQRSIRMSDIRVVGLSLRPTFKTADVAEHLLQSMANHPKMKVVYVVSDGGYELIGGIKQVGLPRIADCHHFFAKELKKQYAENSAYQSFMDDVVDFKRRNNMNDNACILPPRLGHHSRFMNVGQIARWAERLLNWPVDKVSEVLRPFYKATRWLEDHRPIIEELVSLTELGYHLLKVLKCQGLNRCTIMACRRMIIKAQLGSRELERRYDRYFSRMIVELKDTSLAQNPSYSVLCSSDVVESMFGVFKSRTEKRLDLRFMSLYEYGQTHIDEARLRLSLEKQTNRQADQKLRDILDDEVRQNRKRIKEALINE